MHGRLKDIFFSISLMLSCYLSVSLYTVFPPSQISPVHPAHTLPPPTPKPLAVIKPSIVTVAAEHASYACLSRVEELIMTSQQGPYRQQYICDVHVTQSVKFMQMHRVMNYTVGYFLLCYIALILLLINPIFHVETCIYTRPMLGIYLDKKPNTVYFDFMPFPTFLVCFLIMHDII